MSKTKPTTIQLQAILLSIALIISGGIALTADVGVASEHDPDAGVAAAPASVGVTAGAWDQEPRDDSNGVATFWFNETSADGFPEEGGAVTLTLTDGNVTVNSTSTNPATKGSVDTDIEEITEGSITLSVASTDNSAIESIGVSGLRFDVPTDANVTTVEWEFEDATTPTVSTDIEAERLDLDVYGETTISRGVDQQPENGLRLSITGSEKRTFGFHEEGERIVVRIPEEHRDVLSFNTDTGNEPTITTGQSACEPGLTGDYDRSLTEYNFSFQSQCDLGGTRGYVVDDLFVDSRGANLSHDADAEIRLEMEYAPVDKFDRVDTSANDPLQVVAPDVDVDGNVTTVREGTPANAGDDPVRIDVTDPHGGQIADGSTIEIGFDESGTVEFDTDQTLVVEQANDSQQFDASVAEITTDSIVLDVSGESQAGEGITLEHESGGGIRFVGVDETEEPTNLTVTTNAAASGTLGSSRGDDVEQVTDGGVTVAPVPVPNVSVTNDEPSLVERGHNGTHGTEPVRVRITDPDGESIATDSTVTVTFSEDCGISFDASETENASVVTDGNFAGSVEDVSRDSITINVSGNVAAGDSLTLQRVDAAGLTFNVTRGAPTENFSLNVTTVNEFDITSTQSTGPAVRIVEPTADVDLENDSPTEIQANESRASGTEAVVVNVSDDVGGAVAADTTIEVAFSDDVGVAFDESQNLIVERPDGDQSFDATVDEIGSDVVLLNVTGGSDGGESIRLVRAGDEPGIRFNVSDDADGESVALAVTTHNEERSSTALTGTAVRVPGDSGGDDGGGDDGGDDSRDVGGGSGGGASPTTYADINVTDVSLSATEIRQGETVDVTVTLVNEGSADGTYEIQVRANTLRVASETVDVPKGETRTVTVPVTFAHAGDRKITVDGVEGGTVTIEAIEPESVPDGTEAADAQPVVDMDEAADGTVVEFDEDVTVDAIVFPNASNGTVTVADLEALPEDVPATPGPVIRAMDVEVPADLEDESATIRLSLDASAVEDRDAVRLGRFHDGEWQTLEPESVEESGGDLVYEFETPGFSTFAVFAQETEDPQVTETPQGTDDSTSTATDTDDGDAEVAGFGAFGMVVVAFIAVIAVLLAATGARIYRQNSR